MVKSVVLLFCVFVGFQALSHEAFIHDDAFRKHSAIMLLIDPQSGNIVDGNESAAAFYGYDYNELTTKTIQEINLLSDEQVKNERQLAKQQNRSYFIFRHQTASGEVKTVQVHSSPITVGKQTLLFSIIRNISKERDTQQELWHYQSNLEKMVDQQIELISAQSKRQRLTLFGAIVFLVLLISMLIFALMRKRQAESEMQILSQIVKQSPFSIMTMSLKGEVKYGNDMFDSTQSKLDDDVISQKSNYLTTLNISTDKLTELKDKLLHEQHWHAELVKYDKDNNEFWEHTHIYPLIQESSSKNDFVVISQDITQRKADERQLRLASAVFKTATEAVMICDPNNRIIAVNQAFSQITGFVDNEVLGKTPTILNSGHHDVEFYRQMFQQLSATDQWQGEICNRRKDGEVYYEWLSITALRGPNGELEAYVSLFSDITKRKKAEDKIYQQANFDTLTGLANRNLFGDRLKHSLDIAEREASQVALMYIDLDGFKQINDSMGHSKGDLLLQQTAKRLTNCLRKSDTITRLGGDEFAIILSDNEDIFTIERIATKIIDAIAKPYSLEGKTGFVTASMGIAMFPEDGETSEELLSKADSAMYKAKSHGRNHFQFFTKEMDDIAHQRRDLEVELKQAVYNEDFEIMLQPIHASQDRQVCYAEALVRWQHPERGLLSPFEFITVAEEIGLIQKIGDFVLVKACQEAKNWMDKMGSNSPAVSVNVSTLQFQLPGFVARVEDVLKQIDLPPDKLLLEITESLLIDDDNQTLEQLEQLVDLGVQIAIDDFGTGYSSLSYLRRFPVSKLKIDKSFIANIEEDKSSVLVDAILSMAHSLDMTVVAEGVESEAQLNYLADAGCELLQGYYFSKPITPRQFESYLDNKSH